MSSTKAIVALAALLLMSTQASAAEKVRIRALDCAFEIPADYEIDVSPNSSVTFSAPGPRPGLAPRIRISELEAEAPQSTLTRLLERVVTGPLTVERFRFEPHGPSTSPSMDFTIVRGRRQQAKFDDMTDAEIDSHIQRCLASMAPDVAAASARNASGCASTLSVEDTIKALRGDVRAQPVFSGGGLKGWRLYGTKTSEKLLERGIAEGSLMTHVCAVPAREIFVNDGNACCAVDTSKQFDVTIQRAGESTHVNISRAP